MYSSQSGQETSKREQPALMELDKEYRPEELIKYYTSLTGKRKEDSCRRSKRLIERAMLMELLYRFCKIPRPGIGRLVGGIDYSAVSRARRRLRSKMEREPELRKRFDESSDRLQQVSRVKI